MSAKIIHTENGRLAADSPPALVKQLVREGIAHPGAGGMVLHVHGGLVDEAKARGIADELTHVYDDGDAYSIFPIWEAGLLETLRNNLREVAGEEFFRAVLKRVLSIVVRKAAQDEGDRAAGSLPALDLAADHAALEEALDSDNLANLPSSQAVAAAGLTPLSSGETMALQLELEVDVGLLRAVQAASDGLRDPAEIARERSSRNAAPIRSSSTTLMDPSAVERLVDRPDPSSRGLLSTVRLVKAIVAVSARAIRRYIARREHGLHATLVEEVLREFYLSNLGGFIWSQMKKDTADCFGPDPELFGGTALLAALANEISEERPPKLTVIGHSTGAVYIAHFLRAADAILPAGQKIDVLLLAPAATFSLVAAMLTECSGRIGGFRMFAMSDANEQADRLVPVLYPHSLLYFVSGVVEPDSDTPITGMQRYYDADRYASSEFPDIERVRRFVAANEQPAVWSVANEGAGLSSSATSHGAFDNEIATLGSLKHILKNGF